MYLYLSLSDSECSVVSLPEVHLYFMHTFSIYFHISFVRSYSYFYYLFVKYSQKLLWVFRILLFLVFLLLLLLFLFFGQRVAKISICIVCGCVWFVAMLQSWTPQVVTAYNYSIKIRVIDESAPWHVKLFIRRYAHILVKN